VIDIIQYVYEISITTIVKVTIRLGGSMKLKYIFNNSKTNVNNIAIKVTKVSKINNIYCIIIYLLINYKTMVDTYALNFFFSFK